MMVDRHRRVQGNDTTRTSTAVVPVLYQVPVLQQTPRYGTANAPSAAASSTCPFRRRMVVATEATMDVRVGVVPRSGFEHRTSRPTEARVEHVRSHPRAFLLAHPLDV